MRKRNSYSLLFVLFVPLLAQEIDTTTTAADTVISEISGIDTTAVPTDSIKAEVREMEADTTQSVPALSVEAVDSIPPELMGLDYGYKGYAWGTPKEIMPKLAYMDTAYYVGDSSTVIMTGKIGESDVAITYAYGDSGFWKVEIDFRINQFNIDDQINQFTNIEKNITEIYGPPKATSQVISGPTSSYSDLMNIKFTRAYYHSSWKVMPCQIELILHSMVQTPATDLPIIEGNTSFLRLIYYNPDYMVIHSDVPEAEKLPSIFEIF